MFLLFRCSQHAIFFPRQISPLQSCMIFISFRTGPAGRRLRFLFIYSRCCTFADKLTSPLPSNSPPIFFLFYLFSLRISWCLSLFAEKSEGEAGITPILPLYFLSRQPNTVTNSSHDLCRIVPTSFLFFSRFNLFLCSRSLDCSLAHRSRCMICLE